MLTSVGHPYICPQVFPPPCLCVDGHGSTRVLCRGGDCPGYSARFLDVNPRCHFEALLVHTRQEHRGNLEKICDVLGRAVDPVAVPNLTDARNIVKWWGVSGGQKDNHAQLRERLRNHMEVCII